MRLNKKLIVVLVVLAVLTAVSIYVWAEEQRENRTEAVFEDMERFSDVLQKIIDYYVEEMDSDELIDAAIEGMLKKLDPHSVYLDKYQWENLMIETKGEFGGLGITIAIRDGFPTVISPIEGTPAYRLGIQGGDRIVEIEGASTKEWSAEMAVSKLRGRPGTQVNIAINREGLEDSLYYTVTRDNITVPSVTYWDIIDGIGYIRVARFAERTAQDLDEIVTNFEREGIKGLIIDLRSNPGGLLDAAWDVSELFIEKDKLIVYTESRILRHNRKYVSDSKNVHKGYPIVVLVNAFSASASEIVSGALQDWDRAVIVGQTTFGKGSVQTVFHIGGNSALKLTTAKYFTPSGRSIHRDDQLAEAGEEEEKEREQYVTKGGRIVYGGGGIAPDWELELPEYTDVQRKLGLSGVFFSFAIHFTAYHDADDSFEVTPEVLSEFKDFLKTKKIEVKDEQWNEENTQFVKLSIKREVFRKLFGTKGFYAATILEDEEVSKVLEMFRRAPTLPEMFDYIQRQELVSEEVKE